MTDTRFVSTQWLADHLGAPNLVIVDGSWHLPTAGRNAHDEYRAAHIPGAVFLDIDAISDTSSSLPHMLPSETLFSGAMEGLGIGRLMKIVVYDTEGLFSAARVWWTLKAFGAIDVSILEGGFPAWQAEGRPVESGNAPHYPARFDAHLKRDWVASMEDVSRALEGRATQVVDARSAERFRGEAPEPRPGLRAGHMPGACNLPISKVVKDGKLVDPESIRAAALAAGIDPARPVITSCGSGVSAAVIWLALDTIGNQPKALYDGSWAEWGASDKPIITGSATAATDPAS